MTRAVDPAGLLLVKQFEGCRLTAYPDAAGVFTIGWGHVRGVRPGDTCTQAQADDWLLEDLAAKADQVDASTFDVPTGDNEFAAMAALAFNIGTGAFAGSSVLRLHRAGDKAQAADAFLLWDKARVAGALVPVAGLQRRRQAERALYLSPDMPEPAA